jgi:hypothetical protein
MIAAKTESSHKRCHFGRIAGKCISGPRRITDQHSYTFDKLYDEGSRKTNHKVKAPKFLSFYDDNKKDITQFLQQSPEVLNLGEGAG